MSLAAVLFDPFEGASFRRDHQSRSTRSATRHAAAPSTEVLVFVILDAWSFGGTCGWSLHGAAHALPLFKKR